MDDVGGTVEIPDTWAPKSWTNWDFEADSKDNTLKMRLWMSDYQVALDEAAGTAFSVDYGRRLTKLGAKDPRETSSRIDTTAGRRTLWTTTEFQFGSGKPGVAQAAVFAGRGHMIHIRVLGNIRNQSRGKAALQTFVETFKLKLVPSTEETEVSSKDGFSTTLPEGWRAPIGGEVERVRSVTDQVMGAESGTAKCWVGIRPVAIGSPDVMLGCMRPWFGGPVDEHSLASVDEEIGTLLFREARAKIPAAEGVPVGDRFGLMYRPREGDNPIRMVVAPYEKGLVTLTAVGEGLDGEALDVSIRSAAKGTTFSGPNGGKPIIRADRLVGYYLVHRTTSPIVLGPILGLIGLIGFFATRRRRVTDDDWNDVTET